MMWRQDCWRSWTLQGLYLCLYGGQCCIRHAPCISDPPKRKEAYEADYLFPFFTNLLPEGANRKVICREQRIDDKDFFGMLMPTVGTDMIGSVNFHEVENGWERFGAQIGLVDARIKRVLDKYMVIPELTTKLVGNSFLNDKMKRKYLRIVDERVKRFVRKSE